MGNRVAGLAAAPLPPVPTKGALEYEDLQSALCQTRRRDGPAETRAHLR
ncbi:MAG: hypothetical protein M3O70_10280 [Actinomycetota bacterium]|nr:hypothetical protein [Actinomycetota bacterium]